MSRALSVPTQVSGPMDLTLEVGFMGLKLILGPLGVTVVP